MTTTISSLRDHNHREPWIRERSVGSKRANPTTLTDTRSSLADYGLCRIIRLAGCAIVNGTDHSRNHALPYLIGNRQLASNFHAHLVCFFGAVCDLRSEKFAAVCHSRNERSELQRCHFKTIGM